MQESDTYLMILDEGQEQGMRKMLLALGEKRFGPPSEPVKAELQSITDLDRLVRMACQTSNAASWQEVLDTP
jgi:hypothetical protein